MELQKQDIIRLRLYKSGIIEPFKNIEQCLTYLFGIQSQAQQFGEISIFNRVGKLKLKDLKNAYNRHDIIKIWGQRMTVHMYWKDDWKTIHQVYAHRDNFVKRGWADNQDVFEKILAELETSILEKKVSKNEIVTLIEQAASHITNTYRDYSILLQATLDGILFGIPEMPQTKYFAHRSVCIDDDDYILWGSDKEKALEYLLMVYFSNYGPATIADFCHWSGLTKREIQDPFNKIKNRLDLFSHKRKIYYLPQNDIHLKELDKEKNTKFVKLLGKFDPLFVSFSDKSWIVDAEQQKAIWRSAGHVEAILLIGNDVAGTWRYRMNGKNMDFTIFSFRRILKNEQKLIEREASKIAKFLSRTINKIDYH